MAPSYQRLSARTRSFIVSTVIRFLTPEDAKKAAAGAFSEIAFRRAVYAGDKHDSKSPISRAVKFICSDAKLLRDLEFPPEPGSKKVQQSVKNACDYWFRQIAMSKRQSYADEPRRTKADYGLHDSDFQMMGHWLTSWERLDWQGNLRRYASLEHMMQDGLHLLNMDTSLSSEQRLEAQRVVNELTRIKEQASGRAHENLDTLLDRVCTKCRCACCRLIHEPYGHPPCHR